MENNIINHNWKELIKPNKLNIKSSDDRSLTTVTAEPLEKGYGLSAMSIPKIAMGVSGRFPEVVPANEIAFATS